MPKQKPSRVHSNTESCFEGLSGSIAVVGNGALMRDFGKLIDSHDLVIRFNAFELDGFESKCGRKTTHWCTFGETRDHHLPTRHRQHLQPLSPYTISAPESGGILPEFKAKMIFARKDYRLPLFRRPSTGVMLLRLLESLGHTVDVFGFDGFASGHYFDLAHEHDQDHLVTEIIYIATRPCFHLYIHKDRPVNPISQDFKRLFQRLLDDLPE